MQTFISFLAKSSLYRELFAKKKKKINDYAFSGSNNLKTINFKGTMDEWYAIEKGGQWITSEGYKVYCTDGIISVGNVE